MSYDIMYLPFWMFSAKQGTTVTGTIFITPLV